MNEIIIFFVLRIVCSEYSSVSAPTPLLSKSSGQKSSVLKNAHDTMIIIQYWKAVSEQAMKTFFGSAVFLIL